MSLQTIRYGVRFGCRWGLAHSFGTLYENRMAKIERCTFCGKRKRYNKTAKGRIKNTEYLVDHVRAFAQPNGSTKRVYNKIYHPEKCIIYIT